jgi:hypothetical protein
MGKKAFVEPGMLFRRDAEVVLPVRRLMPLGDHPTVSGEKKIPNAAKVRGLGLNISANPKKQWTPWAVSLARLNTLACPQVLCCWSTKERQTTSNSTFPRLSQRSIHGSRMSACRSVAPFLHIGSGHFWWSGRWHYWGCDDGILRFHFTAGEGVENQLYTI